MNSIPPFNKCFTNWFVTFAATSTSKFIKLYHIHHRFLVKIIQIHYHVFNV